MNLRIGLPRKLGLKICFTAALLSSIDSSAEAIGPLPNLDNGELAGHLSPKSEWGIIDRSGKAILPLQYSRVFVLRQAQRSVLVGIPTETKQQTDSAIAEIIPIDYIILDKASRPPAVVKHSGVNRIQFEMMKHGAVCNQLLRECPLRADLKRFSVRFYDTDGFAVLEDNVTGESGVINDSLEWLIEPKKMDLVYSKNDIFSFKTPASNLWGLISKSGQVLAQPIFEDCAIFHNGCAALIKRQHGDHKVVIVDENGRVQRELPEYNYLGMRYNGYCVVRSMKENRYGVIDSRGNLKIPCVYSDITATGTGFFVASESGKSFILDEQGKKRSPGFKRIFPSSDGIVPVSDGEPWDVNLFDLKSNRLLTTKIKFLDFRLHHEGMTIVASNFMLGKLWKLLDRSSKTVFESPWVNSLEFANEGLVLRNENGRNKNDLDRSGDKWGYMDFSGHVIINPIYTDARKFVGGFAAVSTGSK